MIKAEYAVEYEKTLLTCCSHYVVRQTAVLRAQGRIPTLPLTAHDHGPRSYTWTSAPSLAKG